MNCLYGFIINAIIFIDKVLEAIGFAPKHGWILWRADIDPEPMLKSMREFRDALNELGRAIAEAEATKDLQNPTDDSPKCAMLDAMRPGAINKENWN